jgi:AraC-like DNA-binding protein
MDWIPAGSTRWYTSLDWRFMDGTLQFMDRALKYWETCYRDLRRIPRRFPSGLPVRAVGYLPVKRDWVRRSFDRLFFSFILSGAGEYLWKGRSWEVRGPCVFIGPPQVRLEYGPRGSWEELYINYLPELVPAARARGLIAPDRPVWPIHHAPAFRRRVPELLDALADVDSFGCADRIDRLCEALIVESLISSASPPLGERDRAVQAVRAHIEQHYREPLDPDELALEHGLSPSDFRRRWAATMHVAPGRFATALRIREACRLLIETDRDVGAIARSVGFADPLYFSRCFRRLTGESASAYRRRNR